MSLGFEPSQPPHRHGGLVDPEAAHGAFRPPAAISRATRALQRGRDQFVVLPPASARDLRALGGERARGFRFRREGAEGDHAHGALPTTASRCSMRSSTRRRARRAARSGAGSAAAEFAYDAPSSAFFATCASGMTATVVCEPRHVTWFTPSATQLLAGFASRASPPIRPCRAAEPGGWDGLATRLHGSPRMYYSAYGAGAASRDMRGSDEASRRSVVHLRQHRARRCDGQCARLTNALS